MFNHNFIHKFQPRANGARAVVEAVDMDAFASALRGSFARGGRGGRGASTRFRSTRSDDSWRILLIFLEPLRVSRDWSGAERSKTKRGCVNAGSLQSIGAVRARGEFDTEVASTGVEFERARWMNHLDFRAESTFCDFARLALGLLGVGGLRFCPATDVLSMSRLAARRLSSSS